jgi:hypothetical protein
MARVAAHGMAVDPPRGWDAAIYRRPAEAHGAVGRSLGLGPETPMPILHLANVALPAQRGDYGGGVVTGMRAGGIFVSILQHDPGEAATALFSGRTVPWPLAPDDLHPHALPRRFEGGAGHQAFFVAAGRPYCLFVVIAGFGQRARLVPLANEALASVAFT